MGERLVVFNSPLMANGSCFMVTWIIFKIHLLEVGLTQNHETRHSKRSQPLFYSILTCVGTCMNKNSLKLHLVEGPVTYDFTLHFEGPWLHYVILEVPWTLSFGLSQFHGHGSWLVCEVALRDYVGVFSAFQGSLWL